jgi:two-component system cell cycle sensor histidine kinase/response regulator CckA
VREAEDDLWVLADGTRRWFRWAIYPWRDAEGNVGGILITGEDVTRRKEAEEATAASELQLGAIIRSAMDGIITVDESQTILLANPAAERMFGYAPGGLIGRPLDVLIPARHQRAHAAHVRAFGEAGVTHRTMAALGDVEGVRANGELFRLEASISQIELDGRKLFTVIHRDVSERLRAERALKEEEARFRQLAEAIREVFWLTDVAKQRVVYISPGYETIWGRSCQSLYDAPTTWMDAIHPDDRERVRRAALTQQADGGYDLQYRVVRPDGSVRWIHDRAFPVREGADVVRIAGVAEDITERRRLEEQFQQTQKMESVGRLAGGVAHDFNNLLTIILSSAELLREEPTGPFAGEMVDDILDAGRRGATLTRQLLAFTRQEVIEPRVLDLATVVADTEKLLRRLIGEDVDLTVRLDSAAAPVRVDPGQWTQVLLNLAVNARDAMPTGGRLRIATRAVVADEALLRTHPALREGVHAVLEVSDSGGGMSPEVRARVFEPFFTTKPRGKGTGLGLAVVYGVVQQAGGVIEVDSAAGRGTTFTLYVPAVSAAVYHLADAFAASMRPGREVVLLVEDEAAVRRVADRILTAKGYRVITAANGREALHALEGYDGALDLVLTDVVMPELDGAALAGAVRARFPQA